MRRVPQKPNLRASHRFDHRGPRLSLHHLTLAESTPTAFRHPWYALALLALGILLALQIPLGFPRSDGTSPQPSEESVLFRTDASPATLARAGFQVLENYGAFSVARGSRSATAALAAGSSWVDELLEGHLVLFRNEAVDVRSLAVSSWDPSRLAEEAGGVGVVHFYAPIKPGWRASLEAMGIDVLRYLPNNALLVRGSSAAYDAIRSLPQVDAIMPYDAAKKVHPNAVDGSSPADVRIVLLPGAPAEAVIARLAQRGVPTSSILGPFGSGDLRWIRSRVPSAILWDLAASPYVEFIEPAWTPRILNAETAWVIQTNRTLPTGVGDYRYWSYGLDGRGQYIGIADTGVDYDHNAFRHSLGAITLGDLYNVTDPARRKVVRYVNMGVLTGRITWPGGGGPWDPWSIQDSRHWGLGTNCTFGHGTATASTLAGNDDWNAGGGPNDGTAKGAQLYVQDIGTVGQGETCALGDEDLLGYVPEDLADLFGPAGLVYNDPIAPVRVHSDSWGTSTNEYDLQARMIDAFVWSHPDLVIVFPSGNAGPGTATVGAPGTAKNLLTVGGAGNPDNVQFGDDQEDLADLSGRGPTKDGRIKPTVITIFDGDSVMSDGDAFSGSGLADAHWTGTSYATPAAAAAATIIRQYFADGWYPTGQPLASNGRNPSAALVRALLVASAEQMTGSGASREDVWPNFEQGFGRVRLASVLPIVAEGDPFRLRVVDATAGLLTGEAATYTFRVPAGGGRVRFVLAWSDYPAALAAAKSLVNDLDLEVIAPDGTVYRGNRFGPMANAGSVPGGPFDTTNVEEAVFLAAAIPGVWTVRVFGSNVPVGPQPFALVAVGALDGGHGRVLLDRGVYAGTDTIGIEVEDEGASAVEVTASSDSEPGGETIVLSGSVTSGIWRGSIPTGFGPAASDGVLQVRHADSIRVRYADASPPHTAEALARIDAASPVVSEVAADRIGTTSAHIRWRTDEPATAEIRYGTSPLALSLVSTSTDLLTSHDVVLPNLQPDTRYYYDVLARDRLGQETQDSNGGRHRAFQTAALGDVLLVVGDDTFPAEREASYASAFAARGWFWSLWRVADSGTPPLDLLRAHRAVVWQVGLEQYPPFNQTERILVQIYLDGGGRLLVSAHDAVWALGDPDSPFSSPASAAWVRGVLKASLRCDPSDVRRLEGVSGDPISGSHSAGVPYAPHREGGAVDELALWNAGGSTVPIWLDDQVTPGTCGATPVGHRWVASSPNGTLGTGVWGGTPSRLVFFAFELTGLDASPTDLAPNSTTRATVLDDALRWLVSSSIGALDRDHPDVTIAAPNGGVFTGPTLTIRWTASSQGAPLAGFDLYASADLGQTWTGIGTAPGAARSFDWNISSVANGNQHVVRVLARDNGIPTLRGQDETDGALTIARPGGDAMGPTIWAGSVRPVPDPPGSAAPVSFVATADDRVSGASEVVAAELFFRSVPPSPAENGSGLPMAPADGDFDSPTEDVLWSGPLPLAPGPSCAWVHARDESGNWGEYASVCFVALSVGPDGAAPAPARLVSLELANGTADLEIVWERTWDDSLFGGTVAYRVLRSSAPSGPFVPRSGPIPANGTPTYRFRDAGAGEADPSDYFYRIDTIDGAGNLAVGPDLAGKLRIPVVVGPNLLGMPLAPSDPSLANAAPAGWSDAWTFEACGGGWSSARGPGNESLFLGLGRGFWFNATAAGSLLVLGLLPSESAVDLCAGWNLVALPGFTANLTVGMVRVATGADAIAGPDPSRPYGTLLLRDDEVLLPGRGYWIHIGHDSVWVVPGM